MRLQFVGTVFGCSVYGLQVEGFGFGKLGHVCFASYAVVLGSF